MKYMNRNFFALVLALATVSGLTGCASRDLLVRTNGDLLQSPMIKFLQGDEVSVPGEAFFIINSADPAADANAAAQALADDLTNNGQITNVRLTKKLKRAIVLRNSQTGNRARKGDLFGLTATVSSATNDNGTISGKLSIVVNDMTAQASNRLIRQSEKPNNKGFTKLSKASFTVVTDNLAQSTIDAINAGDNASIVTKIKGSKVTTQTLFVPFI